MGKKELDNLVRIGQLKAEAPTRAEFDGMLSGAKSRLADAKNKNLASESRFDLAYGAAHALSLAALRLQGYRPEKRFTVFQSLAHTVDGLEPAAIRIFDRSHNERNLAEYEGRTEVDEQLLKELIQRTTELEKLVLALEPPPQ
jgi:hypothetical protein